MSKEYQNIDELFKTELGPGSVKAPAFVKANIDKQIQSKSNKWIFFLIPIVLLSIAMPIYFWDTPLDGNSAVRVTSKKNNQSLHNLNQDLAMIENSASNENQSLSESQSEFNTSQNSTKSDNTNKQNLIDLKTVNQSTVTNNSNKSNLKANSFNKAESSKVFNPNNTNVTFSNSDSIQLHNKIDELKSEPTLLADNTLNPELKDNNLNQNFDNSTSQQNLDSTENLATQIDSVSARNDKFDQKEQIDSAAFNDKTALVDSSSTQESTDTSSTVEIIKEDPKRKNWTIDAQVFGGLDFIQSKFTSLSSEAVDNFDNNKIKQLSSHFGLAGFVNYKNVSFGTGASFYKVSDEAEYSFYNYSNTPMDSSQTTFFYVPIYDSTGMQIDSTLDSNTTTYNYTVLDSTSATSQVNNIYKIISIPLSFGYTFNVSTWAIKPRISGVLEFSRQTTIGNYPLMGSGNSGLEQLNSLKFGFSLGFELELRKYFGQFYALTRPSYRIKLTNTAFNSNSSIKHNAFSAVVGVGFHFGR